MTVNKINVRFEKIGRFQIKHRTAFLIAIALITLAGFAGLPRFKSEDDEDQWITNSKEQKAANDRFKELFGNTDVVAVLVEADDVFDPEVLSAIDRLGKRLEAEVPFADEVTSLMRLTVSQGTEEGIEVSNPFKDGIPGGGKALSQMTEKERAELAEKKAFIMSRESLVNNIVSDDAKETWVILSLTPYDDDYADMYKVGDAAIPIVEADEFKSDAYTFKGSGVGYIETEESRAVRHDMKWRIITGFIVMLVCLILFIRSMRGVLVPIFATVGGIGTVFGFSGWFGIIAGENLLTLPILLGMALSVGYAIHYINGFNYEFRSCGSRKAAAIAAVKTTGWPILFTVITTMASFISFFTAGIGALRWLGGTCSALVFIIYLYVIVLLPVLYSYGKDSPAAAKSSSAKALRREARIKAFHEKVDAAYGRFGEQVLRHRLPILIVGGAIAAASVFYMFRIEVNMDYVGMMGKKVPYVERMISIMNSKLGNQYSYEVMIELPEADAFKEPENMQALDDLGAALGKLRLTKISGTKPRVTSVTDIVKEMNRTLNGDDPAFYTIPKERDFLTQLLFLYELSGGENLSSWMSDDCSTAYVHVELKEYDANAIDADIVDARSLGSRYFPDAKVFCIGEIVGFATMNHTLVTGELKSLGGSFIIILLLLIIVFSSIHTGFIGMIPNAAPVLLVGGLMGFFGYPLDMLTMTIMPMILGIAVDDTIHFTNHVKLEYEATGDYHRAVVDSFVKIGRSMIATTVILCAMFSMYMFSSISMLFRIGLLSVVGLAAALIADYTLTPVLLFSAESFGKEADAKENNASKHDNFPTVSRIN